MKDRQTQLEAEMIGRLHAWIPERTSVTLLADRGFGKQELYKLRDSIHWDYVIRFKDNVLVQASEGVTRKAKDSWRQRQRGLMPAARSLAIAWK